MEKIHGYTIKDIIKETRNSIIYRGQKNDDPSVIIKVLKADYPTPTHIAQFKHEYTMIKNIDLPGVIKTLEILTAENVYALVLEDFNGIDLKTYIQDRQVDPDFFFTVAINVAKTLGTLHKSNIIHKDIKPHNILINRQTNEVKLADFGISTVLTGELHAMYNPEVIEGTLAYISPEQTGRMNRGVDYRTDLYSLGVALYEAATGNLPFTTTEPMELIHAHIARRAKTPHESNPAIPPMLSRIIMKLLEKTAEDRYQNAFGLMIDLMECKNQYDKNGMINEFELATKDIPVKYTIPQRLYGRQNELELLMSLFDKTKEGINKVLFVKGRPGIGKSAYIHEIHKPIVARRGYFTSGKYDQLQKDIPYSAIIQAFKSQVKQLLTESDEKLAIWKERISAMTEPNGKVLTTLIPDLELIIGPQPDIPDIGPEEAKNRFNYVFEKFAGVFTSREHPLVLFLDDLQWADMASLELIHLMVTSPHVSGFFLIGAFRDNEVSIGHPLFDLIKNISKEKEIHEITLGPLKHTDIKSLLIEFLKCSPDKGAPLSDLIYSKTNGNPFFVNQFLKNLYDRNIIKLDSTNGWSWDNNEISSMEVTDNVIELLSEKLCELPETTRTILKSASIIGNRFTLETLAKISDISNDEALISLNHAAQEGFVEEQDDTYVFEHDRIQEAAYFLIGDEDKQKLHYRIGTMIRQSVKDDEELNVKIFTIIDHYNAARNLLIETGQIDILIELNLMAGKKAILAGAYEAAYKYLNTALAILPENYWLTAYETTLSLYLETTQGAYLNHEYDRMEELSDILIKNVTGKIELIKVYKIRIKAYTLRRQFSKAIDAGMTALQILKVKLPRTPNNFHLISSLGNIKRLIKGRKIEELVDLPEMDNPEMEQAINILATLTAAVYMSYPKLYAMLILTSVIISLKHGNCQDSPIGYACFGIIQCNILGDIETGFALGELALKLVEGSKYQAIKPQVALLFYSFIYHWKKPLADTVEPLFQAYRLGMEQGNQDNAAYALYMSVAYNLNQNTSLYEYREHISRIAKEIMPKLKNDTVSTWINQTWQETMNLIGDVDDIYRFIGSAYSEDEAIPDLVATNERTSVCNNYNIKCHLCSIYPNYEVAAASLAKVEEYLDGIIGTFAVAQYHYFDSLHRLTAFHSLSKKEQKAALKRIKKNQRLMKKWAKHAPQNHAHKYYIIEAELARLKNKTFETIRLYKKAMRKAHLNHFLQDEAIANERLASLYLEVGFTEYEHLHREAAYRFYISWGAKKKVEAMKKGYPGLGVTTISKEAIDDSASSLEALTGINTSQSIDLTTVIKSSLAIMTEFNLDELLKKIMQTALENAGARKGHLILLNDDGELYVETAGDIDNGIRVNINQPLHSYTGLSNAIVNYVKKTGDNVVLDNACETGIFVDDPQIAASRARSVLCMPIKQKGSLSGLLYLENELTRNTFTPHRLNILRILAVQAAISIENIRLIGARENEAQLKKEMEIAANIQTGLIPANPVMEGYEVSAYMQPANDVGGDYYDLINTPENDWIIIGDVSGHGVKAGLIMMMVQTMVHYALHQNPKLTSANLISAVNKTLTDNIHLLGEDKYMTITAFKHLGEGIFEFAGAHQDIFIYRHRTKKVEIIQTEGIWIGIIPDITNIIKPTELSLEPDDIMLIYTDGITEAIHNKADLKDFHETDLFGHEPLIKILTNPELATSEKVRNSIIELIENEYSTNDDVSLMVVKRK